MENKPKKYFFFRSFFKLLLINIGFFIVYWALIYLDLFVYKSKLESIEGQPIYIKSVYDFYTGSSDLRMYLYILLIFLNIIVIRKIYIKGSLAKNVFKYSKGLFLLVFLSISFLFCAFLFQIFHFGSIR